MPTVTIEIRHFHELLREAYKQGYLNCEADHINGEVNDADCTFDDWLAEAMADSAIGEIQIYIE
ncbi:hypothetical protein EYS14_03480 [Alteromonadaceae bacterium M269]|nr:hypothetical protein EYS14_03480 [Alteromonadaceae bacterium M269]